MWYGLLLLNHGAVAENEVGSATNYGCCPSLRHAAAIERFKANESWRICELLGKMKVRIYFASLPGRAGSCWLLSVCLFAFQHKSRRQLGPSGRIKCNLLRVWTQLEGQKIVVP
jgi:hypothetical protein